MLQQVAAVRTHLFEPIRVGLLVIASFCATGLAQPTLTHSNGHSRTDRHSLADGKLATLAALAEHPATRPLTFPQTTVAFRTPAGIVTESQPLGLIEALDITPTSPSAIEQAAVAASQFSQTTLGQHQGHYEQAACLAAQQWLPARLLRARATTLVCAYCEADASQRRAASVLAGFLNHQANHQQSIAAVAVLRGFCTRQALAEQLRLLDAATAALEVEQSRLEQLASSGIAADVDRTQFDRSRIKIADQRLQLESRDRQLRDMLSELTTAGLVDSSDSTQPILVTPRDLDHARLVGLAFSNRQDLRAWLHLCGQVSEANVHVFAGMLTTLVGGWSLPVPAVGKLIALFCPLDYGPLTSSFRREINLAIATQRSYIQQTVIEKAYALELAYARIALAQQTLGSWEGRLQQLEQLAALGNGRPQQSSTARIGLAEARTAEVLRRLDARLAEIDLAEVIGGVAERCCAGRDWFVTE